MTILFYIVVLVNKLFKDKIVGRYNNIMYVHKIKL